MPYFPGASSYLTVVLRIKKTANISAITNPTVTLTFMLPPCTNRLKLYLSLTVFHAYSSNYALGGGCEAYCRNGTPVVDAGVLIPLIKAWLTASIVVPLKTFRWGLG
ncbi:MAG: hypothetical protein ACP5GL_05015 [Infirmifilum sp.]